MRWIQTCLLIAVVGWGAWLTKSSLDAQRGGDDMPDASSVSIPVQTLSDTEKTEALQEARLLTLNAERQSGKTDDNTLSPTQFPSLEEVVQEQIKEGMLPVSVGENLLAKNASRNSVIRLRVGYIYLPKKGRPFPVITNSKIDDTVVNSANPAEDTLHALGLIDPNRIAWGG